MAESKVKDLSLEDLWNGIHKTIDLVPNILNNSAYRDYVRIVLLGSTGAGKSTLLHILIGEKIVTVKTTKGFVLECPDSKIPDIVIGAGVDSVTVIPGVYVDHKNKMIFIDCPGLLDSEGPFQRILNAYSIHTVLKSGGKIKLLFVIERNSFYSLRGQKAIQNFDIVEQLIPDKNILKQCLALAITKSQDEDEIHNYFEYLKSGEDDEQVWSIDYFLNEGKNEIFMVPEPEEVGDYNVFTDFDNAFKILRNHPADSPHNKIVLDNECIDQMKILAKQLRNETNKSLEEFKKTIPSLYEKENDLSKLYTLDKNFDSLIAAARNGLNQFSQQVSIVFPAASNNINEKIEKMIPWRNFLYEILDESIVNENLNIDLSSLISSLSGHLANIKKIEKQLKEKDEKERKMNADMDKINSKYEKDVNELEEKERKNLISKEQKERELRNLRINYESQYKEMENEKRRFEENEDNDFNLMMKKMKEDFGKEKIAIDDKLDKLRDSYYELRTENAVLQQKLQYEEARRREEERKYREEQAARNEAERRHREEMERMKKKKKRRCLIQ